jgi:hypothetical protein
MLAWTEEDQPDWKPSEFGSILAHQLGAPVLLDLGQLVPRWPPRLKGDPYLHENPRATFRDVLCDDHVSTKVLTAVRDFASACLESNRPPLPRAVSVVLLYLVLAVGLVKYGRRMSRLGNRTLSQAFDQVSRLPWLDDQVRTLLHRATSALRVSAEGSEGTDVQQKKPSAMSRPASAFSR